MFDSLKERLNSTVDKVLGAYKGALVGNDALVELNDAFESVTLTREALDPAVLQLTIEDQGWTALTQDMSAKKVDRASLLKAVQLARIMYLLNPLIKRAVTVQELYVWGSGCNIKSDDEAVQECLDDFFEDPKNQSAIGDGWAEREREQRIDGNVFYLLYKNPSTGAARVRTVSIDEIDEIYCNPQDRNEPWFYRRLLPDSGEYVLYPELCYEPTTKVRTYGTDVTIGQVRVDWNVRVLHVKTGGIPGMKFGMPEMYSVLNWATAYKGILENFASILKAFSRIAMKMSGLKGEKGVAAAKSKLGTGMTNEQLKDNNPPPNTASWMMLAGNADVSAVKTAGHTTGPDEARALRSMVAAGTDTPEHFFGDSDVGNFATSETLDRPTELKMIARQSMYVAIIGTISKKLLEWSTIAPNGVLRRAGFRYQRVESKFDGSLNVIITPPDKRTTDFTAAFPTILERNVTDRVRALVMAATLGGRPAEGLFKDRKLLFNLMLKALGEKEADKITELIYPDGETQGFVDPADKLKLEEIEANAKKTTADAMMTSAKALAKAPRPAGPQV